MKRIVLLVFLFCGFLFAGVNINTATQKELMSLSGIGEAKAKAIIEYRSKTKFKKIEDIMQVPGIGKGIFEKIKEDITVTSETKGKK